MPKKRNRQATKIAYSESDSEYDDEIQTYHKQKDKILLDSDHGDSDNSEEEEVYGIDESSEDEEIAQMQQQLRQIKRNKIKKTLGSDLEDGSEDEGTGLPDSRAWGSKKSWFMGGDVRDNKIILSGSEDEAGAAALEEKEMREIEKRRLAQMSEEDYLPPSLMMLLQENQEKKKKKLQKKSIEDADAEKEESEETKGKNKKSKNKKSSVETGIDELERIQIQTDFSKLPKEAEFEKMKETHPEYTPLVNDFGLKMTELRERIMPLMGLVRQGQMDELSTAYARMKYHIICNYLICGGFYMYLMAKRTARIHHHPVMKRLLELQQFYNRLAPFEKKVKADVDHIVACLQEGQDVGRVVCQVSGEENVVPATSTKRKARTALQEDDPQPLKKRKIHISQESGFDEKVEDEEDEDEEEQLADADEDDNEDDELERRAITHEMEKNKGLTAHRKKELKNPRVKHRRKYRRALIRRKGQVRDYKPHKTAYTGEMTGIRAGIIRSRKLK